MRVREWAGNWNAVWENILLRSKLTETIVDFARKLEKKELLEAETRVKANEMFHILADRCKAEIGTIDAERVFNEWLQWFKKYAGEL
jgi:hypothetical protein